MAGNKINLLMKVPFFFQGRQFQCFLFFLNLFADTQDRRVEGQVTSQADTLTKEVENLKDQLHVQTKVNCLN